MLQESLLEIFERDLNKLKDEISLYRDENSLWIVKKEISNSAGNLCLHLIGNLNHFIGATLGNTGYVRNRDNEFVAKNILRKDLISEIEKTIEVVFNTLNKLSAEDFEKDFPVQKHDKIVKTDFMLLHLLTHFNYHLGQINYHRRLI
ncbi:MAG TPA: DUF1572 family protein [Ignavibacteriaceae bacterium]|nr:DUF1572 family protein [Ignavibacteriaceae bacterium]